MIAQLSLGLKRTLHIGTVGHIRRCQCCGKMMDWRRAVTFERPHAPIHSHDRAGIWCAECWDTMCRADELFKQYPYLDGRLLAAGLARKPDPID